MKVSLALVVALGLGMTLPVDHLLSLLVVLLDVAQVVPVVWAVIAVLAVALGAAPVTVAAGCRPAEKLHLPGQSLQLVAELPVLLLQQRYGSAQGLVKAGRLLQPPLHPQLEGADVHMDFPDGVPQGLLVAGQGCAHRLTLRGGGLGVTHVPHLSQGFHGSELRRFSVRSCVAPQRPSATD